MSVPPDILSQILQGGLLNYQQPQSPLDQGLMSANPTLQFGAQLAANAAPGRFIGLVGKSLLGMQQQQQQNAQQQLALRQQAQSLGLGNARIGAMSDYLSDPSQAQSPAAPIPPTGAPQSAPPPMLQAPGYQGYNPGVPTSAAANQAATPNSGTTEFDVPQADLYSTPIGGHSAQQFKGLQIAFGKDPGEAETITRKLQLENAQAAVKPHLAVLDQVVQSDNAAQMVSASAPLKQLWAQAAPQYGINPMSGFNDANVRRVMSARRNQLAAWAQLPTEAPPNQLRTVQTGLGGSYQVDDTTGKITSGAPQQETAQFVDPSAPGGVRLMTKAQGMARGLQPYNPQTFVNTSAISPQAHAIATYRQPAPSAFFLKTAQGQELMKQVFNENPNYDATEYSTKQSARKAFATGKDGNTVRSLSVATDHLDQLDNAVDALKNGGIPAANKVANFFSQQIGNPAVTNFNAMKNIVGDEVVKAVVGSGGGVSDRDKAQQDFNAANSPEQLKGVIQKYKGLMGGQLNGLRRQYEKTTGLSDFEEYLSDQARGELGGGQSGQSLGLGVGQSQQLGGFTVRRVK